VGIGSESSLSALLTKSRFAERDCDLLRPNSFVKLRPRLEPELGGGTVGDLILASEGRPSASTGMLLTIGGGRLAL
jgi:hypothetical protein